MFLCHSAPLPLPLTLKMPSHHGLHETNSLLLLKVIFLLPISSPYWLNINSSIIPLQCPPNTAGTPASLKKGYLGSEGGVHQGGECYLGWGVCFFLGKRDWLFSKIPVKQLLLAVFGESVSFLKPSWASSEEEWFSWSLLCVVFPVVSAVRPLS